VATSRHLTVFFDAISSGGLDPAAYDHFWVEAGSMSSGGSHNQLELPRGANEFFGFNFGDYGNSHEIIGRPVLTISGRPWRDRKLTWHGNNMMERINLPTKAKGGFDYREGVALFTRTDEGFELQVVSETDPLAIDWRGESSRIGRVYRLGGNSNRVCGLF
jgi:hypothetical protein